MPARQLLAKIHIAKKELGLDEDTYRDALFNVTGKRSAKEMSDHQIIGCLKFFARQGFQGKTEPKKYDDLGQRDPYKASPAQLRKIEAMWHEISYGPLTLRHFLFKTVKVSDILFLDRDKANNVIEAIKDIMRRRKR